jgi:hypothetical protein
LLATVVLHDALIAPTKTDGTAWDWPSPAAAPQLRAALSAALAIGDVNAGYGTVLGIFAQPATEALAKPDVFGYASMFRGAGFAGQEPEGRVLPVIQDSFTPTWGDLAIWNHVPLTQYAHLDLHLEDKDLRNDDPVGDVSLTARDFVQALQRGGNVHLPVATQGEGRILYVGLFVAPEPQ